MLLLKNSWGYEICVYFYNYNTIFDYNFYQGSMVEDHPLQHILKMEDRKAKDRKAMCRRKNVKAKWLMVSVIIRNNCLLFYEETNILWIGLFIGPNKYQFDAKVSG